MFILYTLWVVIFFLIRLRPGCLCSMSTGHQNQKVEMSKSTTPILIKLRESMRDPRYVEQPVDAYIVPTGDSHQSEYVADCDARRSYISGFKGSAGTALVTQNEALLWTDGRYYLQAEKELDSNWKLMKLFPLAPTMGTWLTKNLPKGARVGVDGSLFSYRAWKPLATELEAADMSLVHVPINLVDVIWADRPSRPCNPIQILDLQFAGKSSHEKVEEIRQKMSEKNAVYLLTPALDEIAWLLNLRGQDIIYNPVFFAYVILTHEDIKLFVNKKQFTDEIIQYLVSQNLTVNVYPYEDVNKFIQEHQNALSKTNKIWISATASYSYGINIPEYHRVTDITPINVMKAIKNPVERKGMESAHIKDGVALVCFLSWLEKQVAAGARVTEVLASKKVLEFRSMQKDFMGPSFSTISAVGAHGAIIHFQPSVEDDKVITDKELYLCDSGAQFRDGTTDITRTVHFGTPTEYEKECFTRVFKGQTMMGTAIFPTKTIGSSLDILARKYLYDVGLEYKHGTSHGVGSFLNVHEGPIGITWRACPDDPGLQEGMFISNEPGYYEDGKFGIRIEDVVEVVPANTPHNYNDQGFLTFKRISLAPIQTKMLLRNMLTEQEIDVINKYHQECRDTLSPLLEEQGHLDAKEWLHRETEPISKC